MDIKNKRVSTAAERIKARMNELKLKQVDVANRANIDKGSLSHYISGRYEPKDKIMYRIAKVLDVDEMWLWGYDVPKERHGRSEEHEVTIPDSLADKAKLASDIVIRLGNDDMFCDIVTTVYRLDNDKLMRVKDFLSGLID